MAAFVRVSQWYYSFWMVVVRFAALRGWDYFGICGYIAYCLLLYYELL